MSSSLQQDQSKASTTSPHRVHAPVSATVLLVEDHAMVRECLRELLDEDYRVSEAVSAAEALECMTANGVPDVLVADMQLGSGMDGLELIAAARLRWPGLRAVLISGINMRKPVLDPGDRFLRKPFAAGTLTRAIGELVTGQHDLYASCPPRLHGGTERVMSPLAERPVAKRHDASLFASEDEELGGPLLLCERPLTQLAPFGLAMSPLLEQTHAAVDRSRERTAGMRQQTASPLRVGFALGVPTAAFQPLFEELVARLPGFDLSLTKAGSADLCEAMLHGTLDAAVVSGEAVLPDQLNRWTLFANRTAPVMSRSHVLAAADAAPPPALDGEAAICPAEDCATAELVHAGLGSGLATKLAGWPNGPDRQPVAGEATHDVVLVAVAGWPTVRAADAFIKLARAREWSRAQATATSPESQTASPH